MKATQLPRGDTSLNDQYTGLSGQLTIDTSRNEIRLHDGVTPGGHRILNLAQLLLLFMSKDSEFGQVSFTPSDLGILTRVGDRDWVLRALAAGDGILITNPVGTADDPLIAADQAWIENLIATTAISRVYWGGVTQGTADALTLDFSADRAWDGAIDGAVVAFKTHIAINENASIAINNTASKNIRTMTGSTKANLAVPAGSVVFLIAVGSEYYLIGVQEPNTIGIDAIVGMAATNVQDALEELYALVSGIGSGAVTFPYFVFGELTNNVAVTGSFPNQGPKVNFSTMLPNDGAAFIAKVTYSGYSLISGEPGGATQAFSQTLIFYFTRLNGTVYGSSWQVGIDAGPKLPLNSTGTNTDNTGRNYASVFSSLDYDPAAYYGAGHNVRPVVGIVDEGGDDVFTFAGATALTHSDAQGVV